MPPSLHEACRTDDITSLLSLLQSAAGISSINSTNTDGETALHVAAATGSLRSTLVLIHFGADVSKRDAKCGHTALHKSFYAKHTFVSLALIKAGALCSNSNMLERNNSFERVIDVNITTPLRYLSWLNSACKWTAAQGTTTTDVYVTGKADIALGVPLPRAKYEILVPKRIDAVSSLPGGLNDILALPHSSACTTADGAVYTWGHGRSGRLGHGNTASYLEPTRILSLPCKISQLAGGLDHMLAVDLSGGSVYAWGDNSCGQLGIKGKDKYLSPQRVDFVSEKLLSQKRSSRGVVITHIAAGSSHSLCVLSATRGEGLMSELYAWGSNTRGQLGTNSTIESSCLPIAVKFSGSMPTGASSGGTTGRVVQLAAAGDNSAVVFEVAKRAVGLRTSEESDFSFDAVVNSAQEVYQWGNGVPAPSKVHISSKVGKMLDTDDTPDSTQFYHLSSGSGNRVLCLSTSAEWSAMVMSSGAVHVWSVPCGAEAGAKPTTRVAPLRIPQLEPAMLGLGRCVIYGAFMSHAFVSCLCTGEVIYFPVEEFLKTSNSQILKSAAIVSSDYAGVFKIAAAHDRLFALSSISVPALPHGLDCKHQSPDVDASNIGENTDARSVDSDASSDEEEAGDKSPSKPTPILSLQHICERQLAQHITLRTVSGLLSMAQCLLLEDLYQFCVDFIERNMASLLVFAQIDDIFHLLTEAEEEVHSLCEGSEILRPPVESKQTTAALTPITPITKSPKKGIKKPSESVHIGLPSVDKETQDDVKTPQQLQVSQKKKKTNYVRLDLRNSPSTSPDVHSVAKGAQSISPVNESAAAPHHSSWEIGKSPADSRVKGPFNKTLPHSGTQLFGLSPVQQKDITRVNKNSTVLASDIALKPDNVGGAFSPLKLFDCIDAAIAAKKKPAPKPAPWSKSANSPSSIPLIAEKHVLGGPFPSKFSEIQQEDLHEYKRSAACASRRANGVNTDVIVNKSNKSRWYVDTRPRAESLSEVINNQFVEEQIKLAELAEELELQAAIDAVEKQLASEKNQSSDTSNNSSGVTSITKGQKRSSKQRVKQRTASL